MELYSRQSYVIIALLIWALLEIWTPVVFMRDLLHVNDLCEELVPVFCHDLLLLLQKLRQPPMIVVLKLVIALHYELSALECMIVFLLNLIGRPCLVSLLMHMLLVTYRAPDLLRHSLILTIIKCAL